MMYCYKCGAQIPDDSVFCSKCGTKIITEVQGTGVSNKINNDKNHIDHKALSIYLNDLLGLEFILHKYKVAFSERKKELDGYNSHNMKNTYYKNYFPTGDDDWIKYYGYDDFSDFADYEYNYRTCLHFAYTGTDNKYYLLMEEFYGVWYPWGRYFTRSYDQWKEIDETLKDPKAWDYCNIQARQINNAGALGWFKKKEALMRAVRCFEKYFATFQSECKQGLITNQEKISKLELEFEELKEEKEKFESLLQKTYALNIIPKQFRNIYAIYYLCDFIQSSYESLTTALLHFDLKQIQNKLDRIIEQQEEIIINQKILEAQNDRLFQQNQEYLKKLDKIENTGRQIVNETKNVAMYTEIAASNAKAAALIGIANYLKY